MYIIWKFNIYKVVLYFVKHGQGCDFSAFLKCGKVKL